MSELNRNILISRFVSAAILEVIFGNSKHPNKIHLFFRFFTKPEEQIVGIYRTIRTNGKPTTTSGSRETDKRTGFVSQASKQKRPNRLSKRPFKWIFPTFGGHIHPYAPPDMPPSYLSASPQFRADILKVFELRPAYHKKQAE